MHIFQINIFIQFFSVLEVFYTFWTLWFNLQVDSFKCSFCMVRLHAEIKIKGFCKVSKYKMLSFEYISKNIKYSS